MFKMSFSLQNINNAVLNVDKAMPFKDSTSDSSAGFNMDRRGFIENQFKPDPLHPNKKWAGGMKDASDVSRRRRVAAVGKGTINSNPNELSFTTSDQVNVKTQYNALHRVRSSGAVAPAKKGAAH